MFINVNVRFYEISMPLFARCQFTDMIADGVITWI